MTLKIGHRGAAGTHPENTMASFLRAAELGCDGVEFDIHRTSDGEIIVIHDATLERTTNGTGLVRSKTLAEIKQVDAGSWKGAAFAGERVPTLREVIRGTAPTFQLFVEMKAGSVHYPGIEEQILELLREEGALQRSQISSFDHHALRRLRELSPDVELGMLFSANVLDPVGMARECGASALHPFWQWASPAMLEQARAARMKVNVWTVNEPPYIGMMKALGVDGIMSDFPDRL